MTYDTEPELLETMTVGELRLALAQFDAESPVYVAYDGGFAWTQTICVRSTKYPGKYLARKDRREYVDPSAVILEA